MKRSSNLAWNGERNRPLNVYRPCPCRVCTENRKGVGYLSYSDEKGRGLTIWVDNEHVFRRLRLALRHSATGVPGAARGKPNEGLHNTSPPKPDRLELLKQVRRATVDDQLYLLQWLEGKYSKIRPKTN